MTRTEVDRMLHNQRVMVLASFGPRQIDAVSQTEHTCWAAPVYYVHHWLPGNLRLFFTSSPRSLHICHLEAGKDQAAAVFDDHEDWRQIRGLQMKGKTALVEGDQEEEKVHRLYVGKFPVAEILLGKDDSRTQFYCLQVEQIDQVDNRYGFGRRPVDL